MIAISLISLLTSTSNLTVLYTFTGLQDEAWFFLISIAIEAAGGRALPCIVEALKGVEHDDPLKVCENLIIICEIIPDLINVLDRMYEKVKIKTECKN